MRYLLDWMERNPGLVIVMLGMIIGIIVILKG